MDWDMAGAIGTLVAAAFAAYYCFLTFQLVHSQKEPNVVLYVRHDESRPTIIQIVIENIGRGLATNIRFKSNRSIPARAFGVSLQNAKAPEEDEMKEGPLVEGIAALGPGDSRKIDWGQFGGLYKALGDEKIEITCNYENQGRSMKEATCFLDVRSFKETHPATSEPTRIFNELEMIRKILEEAWGKVKPHLPL